MNSRSTKVPGWHCALGLFLMTCLLLVPFVEASARSCIRDQEQVYRNYGFDISDQYDRWQEFVLDRSTICRVSFVIDRRGTPSNLDVTIEDEDGSVVYNGTKAILLTGVQWHAIEFGSGLNLVPGRAYKLRLRGLEPSPDPSNRMFWLGKTESSYDVGVSDVDPSWVGYDYCFRIHTSGVVGTALGSWGMVKARYESADAER